MSSLALRELWMSFRLFVLLVAYVAVGATIALLPSSVVELLGRLAVGLAGATLVAALVAAWSIAVERRRGRTGWLVGRDVPRGTYLAAWFVTLAAAALVGHVTALAVGWMAGSTTVPRLDLAGYAAAGAVTLAPMLAAVALGMLAGTVLPPMGALAATAVVVGGALAAVLAGLVPAALVPGAEAFAILADLSRHAASGAIALAAGSALVAAAIGLGLARVAFERVSL